MPTLDATSSAVFASVGISASTIYNVFVTLVQMTVAFSLWLIQVVWPFLLAIIFIYALWRIIHMYRGVSTRNGQYKQKTP